MSKSEGISKNLFNNDFIFKLIHLIEESFDNLFNNDFTFKFVHSVKTIIFDIKSSIFQKKKNDVNLYFYQNVLSLHSFYQ